MLVGCVLCMCMCMWPSGLPVWQAHTGGQCCWPCSRFRLTCSKLLMSRKARHALGLYCVAVLQSLYSMLRYFLKSTLPQYCRLAANTVMAFSLCGNKTLVTCSPGLVERASQLLEQSVTFVLVPVKLNTQNQNSLLWCPPAAWTVGKPPELNTACNIS